MLFSVIVPVYNVEKYIREAVQSVLEQGFSDFELILVDDGSPDGCPQICDAYARQDGRVRALHQVNAGVSAARNAGFRESSGDYLVFLDGDDRLAPGALGILAERILKCPSDIVIAKFKYFFGNGNEFLDCDYSLLPLLGCPKDEVLNYLFAIQGYGLHVWGYAFRRDNVIKKGLFFNIALCYAEDANWLLGAITSAESFCTVNEAMYFYRIDNLSSIMHDRPSMKRFRSSYSVFTYWFDYFERYKGAAREGLLCRMADGYVNLAKWIYRLPANERVEAVTMFRERIGILSHSTVRVSQLLQPLMKVFGVVFYSKALSFAHFLSTKLKGPAKRR